MNPLNIFTNRERLALIRGVLFTVLVSNLYLPVVIQVQQWLKLNIHVSALHAAITVNRNFCEIATRDVDVYNQLQSQENYQAIEWYCFAALSIIVVTNLADHWLFKYRRAFLRTTLMYRVIMTVRNFLMEGIMLADILCIIISWMQRKTSETVVILPWQEAFNPTVLGLVAEFMTMCKLVLSILIFCSLVSKFPAIVGKMLKKQFQYGIEEVILFLVYAALLEVSNIGVSVATVTFYAAVIFSCIVAIWNFISVSSNLVTFWIEDVDFRLVGGPRHIPQNGEIQNNSEGEEWITIPTHQKDGKEILLLSCDARHQNGLAFVPSFILLSSAPQQNSTYFQIRMRDKMKYTSLEHLDVKQMSWPTSVQYGKFLKRDVIKLCQAVHQCFNPQTLSNREINLYQKIGIGVTVGSADDMTFCITIEDALNRQITQIHIDQEDSSSGPPATVHYQDKVDWEAICSLLRPLEMLNLP